MFHISLLVNYPKVNQLLSIIDTLLWLNLCAKQPYFSFTIKCQGRNDRWRLFILKCSFQYVLTSHKSSGFAANLISIYHFLAYSPSISQEDFRGLFLSFRVLNLIRSGSVHSLAECFIILLNNLFRLHNIKKQYLSVLKMFDQYFIYCQPTAFVLCSECSSR